MDSRTYQAVVADNVRTAVESAGRSTNNLAESTGIPRVTLIRRLSGHSSFTVVELHQIATLLAVDPADFMKVPAAAAVPA